MNNFFRRGHFEKNIITHNIGLFVWIYADYGSPLSVYVNPGLRFRSINFLLLFYDLYIDYVNSGE
jgi:hypothetical protein